MPAEDIADMISPASNGVVGLAAREILGAQSASDVRFPMAAILPRLPRPQIPVTAKCDACLRCWPAEVLTAIGHAWLLVCPDCLPEALETVRSL